MTNELAVLTLRVILSEVDQKRGLNYGNANYLKNHTEALELAIVALTRKPSMAELWRPISEAPQGGRLLLCRGGGDDFEWGGGIWDDRHKLWRAGQWSVWGNQPTHFIEIEGPR